MENCVVSGRLPPKSPQDPVISEINWFINNIYQPAYLKYQKLSKLTRTISANSAILAFVFLSYFGLNAAFPKLNLFAIQTLHDGYDLNMAIVLGLPVFLVALIVCTRQKLHLRHLCLAIILGPRYNPKFAYRKENLLHTLPFLQVVLFLSLFLFCFTPQMVAVAGIINVIIFVGTYMVNRLFGYTSATTRNQIMIHNLKRLQREYEIASFNCGRFELERVQADAFASLFQLEKDNVARLDKEIMGDHYKVHDSAFNIIKGLRK
ncbi:MULTISPECIES: hypothetical protein [Pseudoalteromonas]|uniref:hypothetical protein n=1 Tax=Pseudoalteromonas TaxID=53246 RepID=UPI000F78180F|nr:MULTISPECIES: hypothetical protein [Pseudoalteromonas]